MVNLKDRPKIQLILGFIANLIVPGLGTIILERYVLGIMQLTLTIVCILMRATNSGLINTLSTVSLILLWVWALISGIQAVRNKKV